MADLARPARVSNVDKAQPVGEPCGRYLGSRHLFARLMAGRELRSRCAVVKAVDMEACEWHRVPLVRDVDEPQAGGRSGRDARHVLVGDEQDTAPVQQKGQRKMAPVRRALPARLLAAAGPLSGHPPAANLARVRWVA